MSTQLKNNYSAVELSGNNSRKKSNRWLWLLLLLVVIVIVIFVLKKCQKEVSQTQSDPAIPVVVADTVSSQPVGENSVANEENVIKQSVSDDAIKNEPQSLTVSQSTAPSAENYDEIARTTVRGDYGNGKQRKKALGSKYPEVQRRVNKGKGVWWNPID